MTKRQKQARQMAAPRPRPEANGLTRRENALLAELQVRGWQITTVGPWQLFITKVRAA